jgi:hypothetical protein
MKEVLQTVSVTQGRRPALEYIPGAGLLPLLRNHCNIQIKQFVMQNNGRASCINIF